MAAVKIVPGNSKFGFEFWEAGCGEKWGISTSRPESLAREKCAWMQSQRRHSTSFWATGSKLSLVSTVHWAFLLDCDKKV